MRAEYRRDLQNNYLILELPEEVQEEGYQMRMALQNTIPGLLPFHSSAKDGKRYLHYEITSKQTLTDVYEKKTMDYPAMVSLLTGIETTLEKLQQYLLNPAQLVFDPRYMYLEPGKNRIWLCYLPGTEADHTISLLAEFILKKLDHEEYQAVALGYSFYQKATEENFSLQGTLRELLGQVKEGSKEENANRNFAKRGSVEPDPSEFPYGQDEYGMAYTDRRFEKKREGKTNALFGIVHPAVLFSGLVLIAGLEILFYIKLIGLREAGGLFFLILSLELLINRALKKSGKKKKGKDNRRAREEEEEMYRMLREEMYEAPPDA